MRSRERLELMTLSGTAAACGQAYGRAMGVRIMGFGRQELRPDRRKLAYARRCWAHVQDAAPVSAGFMRGMASATGLSLEHVVLTALQEEICHLPHCTAFAATGSATHAGDTIVALNWDWSPAMYVWAGLLRLAVRGQPAALTYHYPGLWATNGINECGLAVAWTSSGLRPLIRPVVGLPTYVLVAELLRRRSVDRALAYLGRVRHAGSFNLLIGDAGGAIAVVEAIPGRIAIARGEVLSRANHFELPEMIRRSKQDRESWDPSASIYRARRMAQLTTGRRRRISCSDAKRYLTERDGEWPWIHLYPAGPRAERLETMTVDSLVAVCQSRVLWTCRGGRTPGPWQRVTV